MKKAFVSLDRDGAGVITVEDIMGIYDVSKDKDFINGSKSKK